MYPHTRHIPGRIPSYPAYTRKGTLTYGHIPPRVPLTGCVTGCICPPWVCNRLYMPSLVCMGGYVPLLVCMGGYVPLLVYPSWYMPGIHSSWDTPSYTPLVYPPSLRSGTRHPSCWPGYRLTALRRTVAEVTVRKAGVTVRTVTVTRFTVGLFSPVCEEWCP